MVAGCTAVRTTGPSIVTKLCEAIVSVHQKRLTQWKGSVGVGVGDIAAELTYLAVTRAGHQDELARWDRNDDITLDSESLGRRPKPVDHQQARRVVITDRDARDILGQAVDLNFRGHAPQIFKR